MLKQAIDRKGPTYEGLNQPEEVDLVVGLWPLLVGSARHVLCPSTILRRFIQSKNPDFRVVCSTCHGVRLRTSQCIAIGSATGQLQQTPGTHEWAVRDFCSDFCSQQGTRTTTAKINKTTIIYYAITAVLICYSSNITPNATIFVQ